MHVWSSVQRAGCFQLYIVGNAAGKRQSRRVWKCRVQSACSEVGPMAGPNNIRCVLGEAIECCAADAGWPVSPVSRATFSVRRVHPHTPHAGDDASDWCRRRRGLEAPGWKVLGPPSRRKATMEVTAPELRPLHREGSSLCCVSQARQGREKVCLGESEAVLLPSLRRHLRRPPPNSMAGWRQQRAGRPDPAPRRRVGLRVCPAHLGS